MRRINFFLSLILFSLTANAQTYEPTEHGLKYKTQGYGVEIKVYTPTIIRVTKLAEGEKYSKPDLSVVKSPEKVAFQIKESNNEIRLSTAKVNMRINLKTGEINYFDCNDNKLLMEKPYGTQFTPFKDGPFDSYKVRQAFLLDKKEAIYGLGQQQTGKMNQRNQHLLMKNRNMSVCIPMIQSIKGYGIFWDQYSISDFVDNPQEMSMESVGSCADYYFMYGGNADGVIACMRDLTGQSPMLPLWAYGFFQSKERYKTQEQSIDVVAKYRALGVPLDCVVQDWQYWGKDSLWNAMSFNPKTFPNPREWVDKIHKMNAKLMIVAWPGFGPLTLQYKEFKEKNMLINFDTYPVIAKPYDVYNPVARDIYWDYLNKGVFSKGIDGWWLDSTEPDHFNEKEADFDLPTHLGTFRSVHNAFPLMTVGGVYDHQRALTSDKRVVVLTRSAFAGQQRYGSNTWSGDVNSSWESLQKQIPAALNFSICGIPNWNCDIGGFTAGHFKSGAKNPEFQELYVRWFQFGAFTLMMRSHGTAIDREIYAFGKKGDWAYDVQEKYINLRYSLLPYIYSLGWSVTRNSGSFMRALVMDFANDENVYDINNEYMFGQSFLVAPVIEKGSQTKSIYLPAGTDWYDFWNNEKHRGGQLINRETPVDIMPLYVKAGSIIPFGPKVQYATEKRWNNLEIRVYPGQDARFTLYEDENDNYNYEKGAFSEIIMKWNDQDRTLTIEPRKGSFKNMLTNRRFLIKLINGKSESVLYKGKRVVLGL